jgi:hypothetical protein
MLLPGRVVDDALEPIVEARSPLSLILNAGSGILEFTIFGWKWRLLFLAVAGLPFCDRLA